MAVPSICALCDRPVEITDSGAVLTPADGFVHQLCVLNLAAKIQEDLYGPPIDYPNRR